MGLKLGRNAFQAIPNVSFFEVQKILVVFRRFDEKRYFHSMDFFIQEEFGYFEAHWRTLLEN